MIRAGSYGDRRLTIRKICWHSWKNRFWGVDCRSWECHLLWHRRAESRSCWGNSTFGKRLRVHRISRHRCERLEDWRSWRQGEQATEPAWWPRDSGRGKSAFSFMIAQKTRCFKQLLAFMWWNISDVNSLLSPRAQNHVEISVAFLLILQAFLYISFFNFSWSNR